MAKVFALILGLLVAVMLWFIAQAESQLQAKSQFVEPVAVTAVPTNPPTQTAPPTIAPATVTALPSLQPADPAQAVGFGTAVAAWDDTIVVGAPQANDAAGAVYVFQWDGHQWREAARLTAGDGAANDAFGRSVAINDQTIMVGATGHDAAGWEAGAVYVFQLEEGVWRQRHKLLPGSPQDVRFGWAVALDGETAVIGAPYRFSQGEMLNIGSATIFTVQDWQQQARLTTGKRGGSVDSDLFGWSVAVHGSTVAVGAHLSDAVYLYHLVNGQWQREVVLPHGTRGSQFGYSIALAENTLVVGAPAADTNGPRTGTAVLFTRQENVWQETAVLAPDNLGTGDHLGSSIALENNLVVVGARESDGPGDVEASGTAHLFQLEDGHVHELLAVTPMSSAVFGHAVAISGRTVFVGAPTEDKTMGSLHLFTLE